MSNKKKSENITHPDFLIIDALSLIISFIVSYRIKFGSFDFVHTDVWAPLLFTVVLLNTVICLFSNPYQGIFRRPYYEEIIRSLLLSIYNLLISSVIFYVFKIGTFFSRQTVLTMYGIYFIFSLALKCIWKKLALSEKIKNVNADKISLFVVGNRENIEEVLHNAAAGDFEAYEFIGIYLAGGGEAEKIDGIKVFGNENDIADRIISEGADEVLIAAEPSVLSAVQYKKLIANGTGIHMSVEAMIGFGTEDYGISDVGVYKTLSVGTYEFTPLQRFYLVIKRLFDIIIGIVLLPLLAVISAAVKLGYAASGDKAKIFYTQKRVGRNGKPINIIKFRTMVPNADDVLTQLITDPKYKAEWDENQKLADDPRITSLGRFLRKTSIDELPQIINVIKGEMSLVGPRPLVLGELEAHGGMKLYQQIKPGITGWWGCNGRSNIDYRERLELEYYYVKNFSAYLDFLCVLRTAFAVLRRDGAE